MKIYILTDNKNSWFVPYGKKLLDRLCQSGHSVVYVYDKSEIGRGDVCFLLSCNKLLEKEYLSLNTHNIVVHASDLPKGKGFSPYKWAVLEGLDRIDITLFEAQEGVDSGPWYLKSKITLDGSELYEELEENLGNSVIEMCLDYINNQDVLLAHDQKGLESFYRKRKEEDDMLDVNQSIKALFNQLRISDNERYPSYFYMNGHKYFLKIYKEKSKENN